MKIYKLFYAETCPYCGSKDIQSSARTDYCGKCGTTLQEYP